MSRIDPTGEYSLAQAAKVLPGKPSPTSVWRWTKRGIWLNDVRLRLRAVRIGGRIVVTGADLLAFLEAQQVEPGSEASPSWRERAARCRTADAELEALGA
jgi:hypothetical protein